MPTDGLASSPLIGRERELAALSAAVDGSREGGRIVVVEGEAGVGKTVLLGALAAGAGAAGATVLRARGGELERGEGFGIARRLLERVVAEAVDGRRDEPARGRRRPRARRLRPRARWCSTSRPATASTGWSPTSPRRGRWRSIVDDAQWADRASLDWLAYLARRLEDLPVLLALGVRSRATRARARRRSRRSAPSRWRRRCCGRPSLDPAGTADLAARLWGPPRRRRLRRRLPRLDRRQPALRQRVVAGLHAEGRDPDAAAAEWMRRRTPRAALDPDPPAPLAALGRRPSRWPRRWRCSPAGRGSIGPRHSPS